MIISLIKSLVEWIEKTGESLINFSPRKWCLFDIPNLTKEAIRKFFDRSALNNQYIKYFNEANDLLISYPYLYLQKEIDLIYGFHKSFVERHKTRLQVYRADCVEKRVYVPGALNTGLARFTVERELAEKSRNNNAVIK